MSFKVKENFELELERLKKETHEKFEMLFERFSNARNWKIDFEYDWCVSCSSSIDKDFSGWDEVEAKE